jgi:malonyl-CoA O-methyltransferase
MSVSRPPTTAELYDLWAGSYPPLPHNPLMRAEQAAMVEEWPHLSGRSTLDLGCGSGRYAALLAARGARRVVALDLSAAMLSRVAVGERVRGSMTQLPFAAGAFEVVVCGLAVGHVADLAAWMVEVARVLAPGGVLLCSDFHPDAARAGHTRSFKDADGTAHTLEHQVHELSAHAAAAAGAGLALEHVREVRVGHELCEPFAGSEDFYRRWHGLPIVLLLRATRR